jgi:hypothetical protein
MREIRLDGGVAENADTIKDLTNGKIVASAQEATMTFMANCSHSLQSFLEK